MNKRIALPFLGLLLSVLFGIASCSRQKEPPASAPAGPAASAGTAESRPAEPKTVELDLDKAVEVAISQPTELLKPAAFKTPDGKSGWVVRLGTLPLATPAIADGRVFVGGGYGSHEFYAFDAKTGELAWQMKTSDDGPTAAVVEDGLVAFNTESCTVIVADARTGNVVWQEWLGDPLMSQPAIWKGRLYMAYPAGQRPAQTQNQLDSQPAPVADARHPHRLLCADLRTGKHLWEAPITGDVISAPIVANAQVLFTCFDGTSFCIDAEKGSIVWEKANQGTSAPVVANGQVVFSQKEFRDGKAIEGLRRADSRKGADIDATMLVAEKADYLAAAGTPAVLPANSTFLGVPATNLPVSFQALDASVGFSTPPPAAQLEGALKNVGVNTVAGAWAFQGSRAAYQGGQFMNAQGSYLNCLHASTGGIAWRAEARLAGMAPGAQMFSPPSVGRESLYVCSVAGHLAKVRQKDGAPAFIYATKIPMSSQPSLSDGRVYLGSANGLLICLDTGDRDADGWTAWGGNARHNKGE